jgi:DNA-binding transcriptional LysR family regulator
MKSIAMVDLRSFDLNLLVALHALMIEGSVSGAARRIGIGQPAMSHALGRLRDLFGDPLLVRSGSIMRPTARALELAESVARVLDDIRLHVLADRAFLPEREDRVFRLGASDYVMAAILPKLLAKLHMTAPKIRVAAGPTARDEAVAKLGNGLVDVAVGYYPTDTSATIKRETLFHEEHVCLFDAASCETDSPITLDAYVSLPHFLVSSASDFSGAVDTALAETQRTRFVQLSTPNFLTIPFLLRGSRAVGVVPSRLALHCRDAIGLAVSPLPVTVPGFDVAMVWHVRTDSDPAHIWFRHCVRMAAREDEAKQPVMSPDRTANTHASPP